MIKGIYVWFSGNSEFIGVEKKIADQIKVFGKYFDIHEVVVRKEKSNVVKSLLWRLPGGSWGAEYENALCKISDIGETVNFFYIRPIPTDRRYIGFIGELRNRYPEAKILVEFPTYPYGKDILQSRSMWPWFFKDRIYRKYYRSLIDRIITVTEDSSIIGIPTIRIINGIIVGDIHPDYYGEHEDNEDVIRLIAVAQFQPSHGYERIIASLASYYKNGGKRSIVLDMVGYGKECDKYKRLVGKWGLNEHVIFRGKQTGDDLKYYLEKADIGLSGFASYRQSIEVSSSLKVREYLAYGLPVVSGCREDVFTDNTEFFLEFANDRSEVEMQRIIDFYDELVGKYSHMGLKQQIREFAEKTIDMSVTLMPVIDYIRS